MFSKKNFIYAGLFLICSAATGAEVLSLEESVRYGLSNNLRLQISDESIRRAEMGAEEAYTRFFPRVFSSFTYTRLDSAQETSFGGMPPFRVSDPDIYSFNLGVRQPLYTGGGTSSGYSLARQNVRLSKLQKEAVARSLVFEIKKGYFAVLRAEKAVETLMVLQEYAEEHLRVAQSFFEEGIVTRIDVLKTEVFLANTRQRILQARNGADLARASLSFIMNRPLEDDFEVVDILEAEADIMTLYYWQEKARQNRPELESIRTVAVMSGYEIDIARSRMKPQVGIFYNYMLDRGSQGAVDSWQDMWNIGVAVEIDLWNRGETRYRVKQAETRRREVEKEYRLKEKAIELEVKSAYISLVFAEKEIDTVKKTMETALESLRMSNLLYSEGLAVTSDVLDAQAELASAENSYYQALYNFQTALAELEKAAGI